jgi:hydroxyacylglutathione hydrolase
MIFEQLRIGGDRNFAYLLGDPASQEGAVVDPGYNPEMIMKQIKTHGLTLKYVIQTHGHHDHTGAAETLMKMTGAVYVGYSVTDGLRVNDNSTLPLGSLTLKFIHTPGHTPDSICILVNNRLITGDTLFVGKVGGTGFGQDARQEYDSLHMKILILPGDTIVCPGHDYGTSPVSSIDNEKQFNPFLIQPTFEAFLNLKKNWTAYKQAHGIK